MRRCDLESGVFAPNRRARGATGCSGCRLQVLIAVELCVRVKSFARGVPYVCSYTGTTQPFCNGLARVPPHDMRFISCGENFSRWQAPA
eukprot:6179449-Pleurochrysis_carterae.AAC.1